MFCLQLIILLLLLSSCNAGSGIPENIQEDVSAEAQQADSKSAPKQSVEKSLSIARTDILDKTGSRIKNLKLAANAINGVVVGHAEEFSFNRFAGERSKEKGYEKALIIINKEREYAYGGGVCQISSTIYQAAKNANMEILERHDHLAEIHYLPIGEDAAVEYDTLDFRFRNTAQNPVKINVSVDDNAVAVEILEIVSK